MYWEMFDSSVLIDMTDNKPIINDFSELLKEKERIRWFRGERIGFGRRAWWRGSTARRSEIIKNKYENHYDNVINRPSLTSREPVTIYRRSGMIFALS